MIDIKLDRDPYDCEILFVGKLTREIQPGLTILVGCNGSGKTTILHYIKHKYERDKNYHVVFWNGLTDKSDMKQSSLDCQRYDLLATLAFSSEGEEINTNIGVIAGKLGNYIANNSDKDIIVLLDGLDSGLSIDNIIEIKDFFKNYVIPDVEKNNHHSYIVVSANEYELANGERCIDARSGKEVSFSNYDEYKSYILKSKKQKDKRKQTNE